MSRLAFGCALLLFAQVAVAAGPALVITDKGYEIMTVGADGRVKTELVSQVVDLRTGAAPIPPTEPQPPTVSANATRVKAMASKINDPAGSQVLSGTIGLLLENGSVPVSSINDGLFSMTFGVALTEYEKKVPGAKSRWQPFRDEFAGLVNELLAKGELKTQSQFNQFLADAQSGLELSASGSAVEPALDVSAILLIIQQLLPLILEIIRTFTGIGG